MLNISRDFESINTLVGHLILDLCVRYPTYKINIEDILANDHYIWFLVKEDNVPAGCAALVMENTDVGTLRHVWVEPEFRRKGLAQQILSKLEFFCLEFTNINTLILETGLPQPEAIALYEKCGYKVFEEVNDSIYYTKVLRKS